MHDEAPLTNGYPDPGRPRYCGRCATPLTEQERGGLLRPVCPACGWVYYAKPALGAAALIETAEGVLLVQRKHDPYRGWWMLPAGFVEYGEFAQDTAVREAEEETGLRVRLTGLRGLYFGTDDPRTVAHLAVYGAVPIGGAVRAGDDAADVRAFPPDGLPKQIAFRGHRLALADWAAGRRSEAGLTSPTEPER